MNPIPDSCDFNVSKIAFQSQIVISNSPLWLIELISRGRVELKARTEGILSDRTMNRELFTRSLPLCGIAVITFK
jgi:hypothetical protein